MGNLPMPQATQQQWAARRQQFNEWANTQLRKGIDFGVVPGTDKPTLLKPGAEKILQLFGCGVDLEPMERKQDVVTGHLYIEYRARAVSLQTGAVVGMGVGACSTYESKYRYRKEWYNGQGTPGEGWQRTSSNKWFRRIENLDLADQWNTVIKMAKKRAMVDLALTISGASEKFTQDVEDFQEQPIEAREHEDQPKTEPTGSKTNADWTQSKAEREAFKAWHDGLSLSDADCKKLAGLSMGTQVPLALFRDFPGDRMALQAAIERELTKATQAVAPAQAVVA
jgi:hypothetical protein